MSVEKFKQPIVITGGSGLLGLNWGLMVKDEYDVTLGLHDRGIRIEGLACKRISLNSPRSVLKAVVEEHPSLVIHTAGLTNVETCESNPRLARNVNVDMTVNVCEACKELDIPMVLISTDHLFSGERSFIDEEAPVAPVNVYGKTKAEAESRVLDLYNNVLVVRTNFYGWGTTYRSSFSDVIIRFLRSGKNINLFEDVFYTPILISELIRTVHDLLRLNARGIYNVVGAEKLSKYDFGLRLAEEFALNGKLIKRALIKDVGNLTKRPKDMSLSNKKAEEFLARSIGNVGSHLKLLREQEQKGLAKQLMEIA